MAKSFRTIAEELWEYRHCNMQELYYYNRKTKKYGCLSKDARIVLHDAAQAITGMTMGPNQYWLPQIMSEAIEAAKALGI